MLHHMVLAVNGADFFTTPGIGTAIASLMKAIALIVVLGAAIKAVKEVHAGKAGKAAQLILGTVVVVTFLWDPTLIGKLIDLGSSLVGQSVKTVDQTTR